MPQPPTDKPLIDLIIERISQYVMEDKLTNENLVQIIEHAGGYLNLQTRSDYKRSTGLSYNGAKKFRTNKKIFGVN